jgi:hypothetical protein
MNENHRTVFRSVQFPALLILLVLGLTLSGSVKSAFAQDMPIQFRMTGQFLEPSKDKKPGGVHAYTVNVLKKTWIFDIDRADVLQGSMLGTTVLRQIYPPIMTFIGNKEITEALSDPWIVGRTYTLTGQLYVNKRLFRINTKEAHPEEGEGEAPPAAEAP